MGFRVTFEVVELSTTNALALAMRGTSHSLGGHENDQFYRVQFSWGGSDHIGTRGIMFRQGFLMM